MLRHLGVARAHIVGHSSGAIVALGLALGEPDAVASLALLEPPSLTAPGTDALFAGLEPCIALYGRGDPEAAVAMFLTAVFGKGRDTWEPLLDQRVPGGFAQAVKDADTFFTSELPGVSGWTFGPDEGARVRQPSLFVLGAETEPWFVASYEQYRSWLPTLDTARIEDAGHALQMQQPKSCCDGAGRLLRAPSCQPGVTATAGADRHEPSCQRRTGRARPSATSTGLSRHPTEARCSAVHAAAQDRPRCGARPRVRDIECCHSAVGRLFCNTLCGCGGPPVGAQARRGR